MTGGTICMQPTPDGLQPIGGFLENAMATRPSFNDLSTPQGKYHIFLMWKAVTCGTFSVIGLMDSTFWWMKK
jgi:hypothetical protein